MCLNNSNNAKYLQDFVARLSRRMRKRAIRHSTATSMFTKHVALCSYCSRVISFGRAYDVYQIYAHMRDVHHSYGRVWADGVLDDTQTDGCGGWAPGPRMGVSARVQEQLAEGGAKVRRGAGYVGAVTFNAASQIIYI
ncbi:hypothetical protein EV122DRAFT_227095 [Schizophyllum commune]